MTKIQMFETNKSLKHLDFENLDLFRVSIFEFRIWIIHRVDIQESKVLNPTSLPDMKEKQ